MDEIEYKMIKHRIWIGIIILVLVIVIGEFILAQYNRILKPILVKRVAFCFLVSSEFPQEAIWEQYLKVNPWIVAYLHAKPEFQFQSKWMKANVHQVPSIETKWADVSLVKAQNRMLREALKDENVQFCCMISGMCIPLRSGNQLMQYLGNTSKSHFTMFHQDSRFPRYNKLLKHIKKETIAFHHQWCILRRDHASLICEKEPEYMEWYQGIHAPDECIYLTTLRHYGVSPSMIETRGGALNSWTFVQWHDIPYQFKHPDEKLSNASPKTYLHIEQDELDYILQESSAFFARKFARDCKVILNNYTWMPLNAYLSMKSVI